MGGYGASCSRFEAVKLFFSFETTADISSVFDPNCLKNVFICVKRFLKEENAYSSLFIVSLILTCHAMADLMLHNADSKYLDI